MLFLYFFFFFNDTATTEIYTLSLHDALPIFLTTDLRTSIKLLVQSCFDRWQIEVNHRDEKDILGVGQAQVRSEQSIPRHPALAVASYSMLLLAALRSFGPGRTHDYLQQPKWRTRR